MTFDVVVVSTNSVIGRFVGVVVRYRSEAPNVSPTLVSMGAVDRWADSSQWRIGNFWIHVVMMMRKVLLHADRRWPMANGSYQ